MWANLLDGVVIVDDDDRANESSLVSQYIESW